MLISRNIIAKEKCKDHRYEFHLLIKLAGIYLGISGKFGGTYSMKFAGNWP